METQTKLQRQWQHLKQVDANGSKQTITHYGMADGTAHHHLYGHLEAYNHPKLALYEHKELNKEDQPWLFPLSENDRYSDWYLQESLGNYWGVILSSSLTLLELGNHLKHHLIVQDEQNQRHLMRLYDPRVLPAYLDALDATQQADFFLPLQHLWTDKPGQKNHWRCYSHQQAISFKVIDLYPEAPQSSEASTC